jgi:hypothetical protein
MLKYCFIISSFLLPKGVLQFHKKLIRFSEPAINNFNEIVIVNNKQVDVRTDVPDHPCVGTIRLALAVVLKKTANL